MHSKTMKTPLKEKKINLESRGFLVFSQWFFLYNYKVSLGTFWYLVK